MQVDHYLTIARTAETEIEVKRSRFRCRLERVDDEAQARAVIEQARQQHWDARHHCSAFVLEPDSAVMRSSDDGEPAGTAGAPMLEVLRGGQLTYVVAVVTRWFGGTLLGAGGLVRAYSDSVRESVAAAGAQRFELLGEYTVTSDHAVAGRIESDLRGLGFSVLDVAYGARVTLQLGVPDAQADRLRSTLAELSGGTVTPEREGERWAPVS